MHEHRIATTRRARYYTLGHAGSSLRQVWFVCHGYGQLAATFLQSSRALDDGTRLIVAPEGLSRFYQTGTDGEVGASWMTREDRSHEIDDYLEFLDRVHERVFAPLERDRVTMHVLGFSQGVATACRWVVKGSARADQLVLWAGGVPPELDDHRSVERLRALRVTMVWGSRDRYLTPERLADERSRLRRIVVDFDELSFEGGHRLDDDTLQTLARASR